MTDEQFRLANDIKSRMLDLVEERDSIQKALDYVILRNTKNTRLVIPNVDSASRQSFNIKTSRLNEVLTEEIEDMNSQIALLSEQFNKL